MRSRMAKVKKQRICEVSNLASKTESSPVIGRIKEVTEAHCAIVMSYLFRPLLKLTAGSESLEKGTEINLATATDRKVETRPERNLQKGSLKHILRAASGMNSDCNDC